MLINFLLFQAIWFGAVFFANSAIWLVIAALAIHFYISKTRILDAKIIVICGVAGLFVDSLLLNFEFFEFYTGQWVGYLVPPWLVMIWVGFGITLNHSLSYFQQKPVWCVIGGAISGPLSYLAGERLGAISLPQPLFHTIIVLALVWSIVFWALMQATHLIKTSEQSFERVYD